MNSAENITGELSKENFPHLRIVVIVAERRLFVFPGYAPLENPQQNVVIPSPA